AERVGNCRLVLFLSQARTDSNIGNNQVEPAGRIGCSVLYDEMKGGNLTMGCESSDGYSVIDRLMRLRDFLRETPRDMDSIFSRMEADYPATESGKRRLRRDLLNLEVMGFRIE